MDWIDDEARQSDIANQGTCTKQDVAVATGVVGVITGGVSVGLEVIGLGAILTFISVVNSIDDIGTDKRGESFLQQMVKLQGAKEIIANVKLTSTIANSAVNIKGAKNVLDNIDKTEKITINVIDLINTLVNTLNSLINDK